MAWVKDSYFKYSDSYGGQYDICLAGTARFTLNDARSQVSGQILSWDSSFDWNRDAGGNTAFYAFVGLLWSDSNSGSTSGGLVSTYDDAVSQISGCIPNFWSTLIYFYWNNQSENQSGARGHGGVSGSYSHTWSSGRFNSVSQSYIKPFVRWYDGSSHVSTMADIANVGFPQDYFPAKQRKSGLWVPIDDSGFLRTRVGGTWHNVKNRYDKSNPKMVIRSTDWKQVGR